VIIPNKLTELLNIGPILAGRLNQVGIHTYDDLADLGSLEPFARVRKIDHNSFCSMLYAIEGAIQKIRWHHLSEEDKMRLKETYRTIEQSR
jgi:DNA transformation protein